MGTYTELIIGVFLKGDTPVDIANTLKWMTNPVDYVRPKLIDHPFFLISNWEWTLVGDTAYFPGKPYADMCFNHYTGVHELTVRSFRKNYESDFELFLNFIQPYIADYGFVGYMRCEDDYNPKLIYNTKEDRIRISDYSDTQYLDDEWLEETRESLLKARDVREMARMGYGSTFLGKWD